MPSHYVHSTAACNLYIDCSLYILFRISFTNAWMEVFICVTGYYNGIIDIMMQNANR